MQNHSEKNKVKQRCFSAVKTTMIGALDIIETELEEDLKDPEFQQVYSVIRERILDLGNDQIYYLDIFLNKFNVESNRNTYTFYNKRGQNGN